MVRYSDQTLRWPSWSAALAAGLALLAAGCGGGGNSGTSSGSTAFTAGYSNVSADDLAAWVAADGGYFKKNGIDVNLTLISGGSRTMAALLSGEIQVSQQGGSEALASTAGGADVVVIGTLAPVYPYKFEVQSNIQSTADLKGKKIGISNVGGSSDIATRIALPKMGLDPDKDVNIVEVSSHANRTAALLSGALAGAVDDPPDSVTLEAKGLHPIYDLAAQKLTAANTVIVVQRSWLNQHHDLAQKYIDSIIQAIARMKKDRAFTVGVIKKYFNISDDKAAETAYDFFTTEVTPSDPYPATEQFNDAKTYLGAKNSKIGGVDLNKLVDASLVKSAVNRGLDK